MCVCVCVCVCVCKHILNHCPVNVWFGVPKKKMCPLTVTVRHHVANINYALLFSLLWKYSTLRIIQQLPQTNHKQVYITQVDSLEV